MSWLADKYKALKLAWQRFERWERVYLLREPEWRIRFDGTLEDFQNRLAEHVTLISKEEFFKRYKKWKTTETLGFCNGEEFGFKLPNSPVRSVHYLHGIFVPEEDFDYVYGQYRFLYKWGRRYLGNINFVLFGVIFLLLSAAFAYVFEWTTDTPAIGALVLGLLFLGPFFVALAIVVLPIDWLILMLAKFRNRDVRYETYRLLEEICGR